MYIGNQTARIHIGKARLGMDDDTYRAFLQRLTGKTSSKDMTTAQRALVLAEMTRLGAFKDARRPRLPRQMVRTAPVRHRAEQGQKQLQPLYQTLFRQKQPR